MTPAAISHCARKESEFRTGDPSYACIILGETTDIEQVQDLVKGITQIGKTQTGITQIGKTLKEITQIGIE